MGCVVRALMERGRGVYLERRGRAPDHKRPVRGGSDHSGSVVPGLGMGRRSDFAPSTSQLAAYFLICFVARFPACPNATR